MHWKHQYFVWIRLICAIIVKQAYRKHFAVGIPVFITQIQLLISVFDLFEGSVICFITYYVNCGVIIS